MIYEADINDKEWTHKPVHVGFAGLRRVVADDSVDSIQVHAARHHIRAHKHPQLARTELKVDSYKIEKEWHMATPV